jgi:hypothetical protein
MLTLTIFDITCAVTAVTMTKTTGFIFIQIIVWHHLRENVFLGKKLCLEMMNFSNDSQLAPAQTD